jgi:hypothetical protein
MADIDDNAHVALKFKKSKTESVPEKNIYIEAKYLILTHINNYKLHFKDINLKCI